MDDRKVWLCAQGETHTSELEAAECCDPAPAGWISTQRQGA